MKTTKRVGIGFGLFLGLFIGALFLFFTAAEDFYAYAAGTVEQAAVIEPLPKAQLQSQFTPIVPAYDTQIKYRKFFLTVPGAQQVELRGDFNRWGKDPVYLTPYKKGYFETSVALTSGEYKYLFVVDGNSRPDPANQDRQTLENGQEVCIKTVR